jgi:hypothetical protein
LLASVRELFMELFRELFRELAGNKELPESSLRAP